MKRLLGIVLIVMAGVAAAQKLPWQNDSKRPQDVQYLFPEQVSVAAGKDTVIDLHFKVNPGMHINSHTPHEKSLIATRLIVVESQGLKVNAVDFPPGSDYALASLPNDKLSVYTGEFTLHAHVQAAAGQHLLQGALRYQACDTNSCYPPREAPVTVDVIAR
jgi:hypothetical protein